MNETLYIKAAQYLSGELESNEAQNFAESLERNQQLKEDLQIIAQYWNKMNTNPPKNFDTTAAWKKLEERISVDETVKKRKSVKRPLIAIAGIAIVIFGLVAVWIAEFLPGNNQTRYVASQRKTVTLPDNSKIILKKGSTLTLTEYFNDQNRTVNLKGQAWFDVQSNPEKPFIIEAARSRISVLGTSFSVESKPEGPDIVAVKSGIVKIKHKFSPQTLTLQKNQYASAGDEMLTEIPGIKPNYLSWALREFYFSHTSLNEVCKQLSEAYNKKMTFRDSTIGQYRISATFKNQNCQEILNIITATHDLAFEMSNDSVLIKHPD